MPVQNQNITFVDGKIGQGIYLGTDSYIDYLSEGNLDETNGSLEFWIKPDWDIASENSTILEFGGCGGILIFKNFSLFRTIFNRFSCFSNPELDTGLDINSWDANRWYHVGLTWGEGAIKLYLNGDLVSTDTYSFDLPEIDRSSFRIGSAGGASTYAYIDELRLSKSVRSAEEILNEYLKGLQAEELNIKRQEITPKGNVFVELDTLNLLETWWEKIFVEAITPGGTYNLPLEALNWTIQDSTIGSFIEVNGESRIKALREGSTRITGTFDNLTVEFTFSVQKPVKAVEYERVDPYLQAQPDCYVKDIPVVIIRYMPTADGQNLDRSLINWNSSLTDLRDRINTFDRRIKFMLTEGSKYHGYKDPEAIPYLSYRVVDVINVYEPLPKGKPVNNATNAHFPDYYQIVDRFDGEHYVNELGVKEFWLWGWHNDEIVPAESNMSSPTTGDISNSFRFSDDLPVYDHTYVLYNYNFTRAQSEAVHNHGHQIESQLGYVNLLQDNNIALFWGKFVGSKEDPDLDCSNPAYGCSDSNPFRKGRCGWTHMPPNTTRDYDYVNYSSFSSDIEDWRPDETGKQKVVNVNTWGDIPYNWPDRDTSSILGRIESQWYIYWMQNIPGYGNDIPYEDTYITNWWTFFSDWDEAITSALGLYHPEPNAPAFPSSFSVTSLQADDCTPVPSGRASLTFPNEQPDGFSIQWDNGDTSLIADHLAAGIHSVSLAFSPTCVREQSFLIDSLYSPPSIDSEITAASCFDRPDGQVAVQIAGDAPPYYPVWRQEDTTYLITELGSGDIPLQIIDANSCMYDTVFTITSPDSFVIDQEIIPDSVQLGVGQARIEVSGGTPPYQYAWNDPGKQMTAAATGLFAGNYIVTVTDQNNCQDSIQLTVPLITSSASLPAQVRRLDIFPNPFADHLTIQLDLMKAEPVNLRLQNDLGQIIWSSSYRSQASITADIHIDHLLSKGSYFLTLFINDLIYTRKLIRH